MAEALLDDARVDPGLEREGRVGVPEVEQSDAWQLGGAGCLPELLADRLRVDGAPSPGERRQRYTVCCQKAAFLFVG